ncbi:heavy metal sensor kinase [Desulfuromusa kysingii]|uniref:histidine kinase n=1 Tax=Desulfuromusa kysingii TaxID=37625 RepID=A0A1H3XMX1_9BACT|nr:ATP-binding protein [Desulfuromusa kysingii]SDZ99888.1 heavy metal sensor kinase [Desulfuromusa kysingii]
MTRNTHLKSRFPSLSLLFLAIVLIGSGFFWHTDHQQRLLNQIDNQLLSTAQNVSFFFNNIPTDSSAKKYLCKRLTDFSAMSTVSLSLSIYSAQGELLCLTEEVASNQRMSLDKKINPPKSMTLKTVITPQGELRSLIYPISKQDTPALSLVINHNLAELKNQSHLSALILLLIGLSIFTVFTVLQQRVKKANLAVIKRLALQMGRADEEDHPASFVVPTSVEPEIQELASSYNHMMTRREDILRRAHQFTADVTHELRTPLTILRGETELALRNGRDPKRLRQVLESNLEEISRMSYLIEDLLLLSKGDLGEIPLKKEPLLLNELIIELHHQAQLLATAKNIKVELHCPKELAFLRADSLRLRQVFLNLLTNAIKYTPDDGDVSITLSFDEQYAVITITDTGIGIGSEHLETIFDRFYRVNKTKNRNDGGSGLGLAIVKWIVEAHHGSVKVSSSLGQGSSFTVTLPRLSDSETLVTVDQ